ncbi:Uncharacterised protein [Mycobacteroides abscessus]|nr:Uncharacterised protein [Mycobacteroides abscessus]
MTATGTASSIEPLHTVVAKVSPMLDAAPAGTAAARGVRTGTVSSRRGRRRPGR